MANFEGTVPTKQGLVLIGKVGTGVPLNFTRVAVGSGVWSPEQVAKPAAMTGLIKEEMTLAISPESIKAKEEPEGDEPVGCYSMRVMLTNSGLASGFALREIGIYATDPDLGEILYAVDYAGDLYDYIPSLPANAAPLEKIFNLDFLTGTAKEIFVNQSPVLLATVDDIGDHNTDPEAHPDLLDRLATGIPEILTPAEGAEVGETPFFTFRPFVANIANTVEEAIQLQVDLIAGNFAAPIHDTGWLTTIAAGYELPAALLVAGQNIYKSRVRRRLTNGLISPWSTVVMMTTKQTFNYTDRAKNVSPSPGATNVMECPTFVGNAFSVTGDVADTHKSTRGFILKDGVVLYATGDLGPVTEFTPPPGYHQVSGEYEWQIQYEGTILGWGEKSAPTRYHTAAAFITGDEAISFPSWDGYDNASAAGVALTDGAVLRSNGVDQGELEGDWISYQVREKIRLIKMITSLVGTSANELLSRSKLETGMELVSELGRMILGDVTIDTIALDSAAAEWIDMTGETTFTGKTIIPDCGGVTRSAYPLSGDFTIVFRPYQVGQDNIGVGFFPASQLAVYAELHSNYYVGNINGSISFDFDMGNYYHAIAAVQGQLTDIVGGNYEQGDLIRVERRGSIIKLYCNDELRISHDVGTEDMFIHVGCLRGGTSVNRLDGVHWESSMYRANISAAGFISAPTKFAFMPTLTAATGAAGTSFTAADFNEIPVANATLGTDTDTDRPDFILLESEEITPATPFRRVAIGASGLSKDTLINITETQCDTWRQGA